MLVKGTDIIGSKIITVNEGKEIEDIDDIIYDPKDNRVKALLVAPGGVFSDAKVLLIEDAKGIGSDAVLVQSADSLKNAADIKEPVSSIAQGNTYLTQNKVVTEEGKNLGIITDVYFDNQTGQVEEFEVSQGLEDIKSGKKKVKIADVITVGEDAVIVKGYTEEKVAQQAKTGGIQGKVSHDVEKIQKEAPKVVQQTREKTEELIEKSRAKVEEFKKSPQTEETIEKAKLQAQQIQKNVGKQTRKVKKEIKNRY
jgi:uncharacterized protein YrrD